MRIMTSRPRFVQIGLAPALLAATIASPLAAEPGAVRKAEVTIVPLCSDRTRLTAVELAGKGTTMNLAATCVGDAQWRSGTDNLTVALQFDSDTAVPQSVIALELMGQAMTQVKLTPSGETMTVRANGRSCLAITATTRQTSPVPGRFLGQERDWRNTVDYMVDAACRVIAVRMGNLLAIAARKQGAEFDLYGVHFKIGPEEGTP